jgi:hypothetical protein
MRDTAYYFNEQGRMIYCDTSGASTKYFVIRTCKTKREMFSDWYNKSPRDGHFDPADVNGISAKEARKVERLIHDGKIKDPFVIECTIEVYCRELIKRMFDKIPDSGNNTNGRRDCREYAGVIDSNENITMDTGVISNPCEEMVEVWPKGNGIVYFHSHPSCEKDSGNCAFIQAPSKNDQLATRKGMGYVFGMNKNSHRVYVYNYCGIQATLPFCFFLTEHGY